MQTTAPFIIANNSFVAVGGNSYITINQTSSLGVPITPVTFTYNLPSVGAITNIVVATDSSQYWFIIGGSKGLVVLGGQAGAGWNGDPTTLGLLSIYPLGSYSHVRTLKTNGAQLFILTDTLLDSLIISPVTVQKGGTEALAHIANTQQFQDTPKTFSDLHISGSYLLLATTVGLFQASSPTLVWQRIALPESPLAVSALYTVTSNNGWENIYALATSASRHQSSVYRLALTPEKNLSLFQDYFIKNIPTFFINVEDFRNYMTNNGALFELSRSRYLQQPVIVEKLPPDFRFGEYQLALRATPLIQTLPTNAETIRRLSYDPATGASLAYGNFGIMVNQY